MTAGERATTLGVSIRRLKTVHSLTHPSAKINTAELMAVLAAEAEEEGG